MFCPLDKGQRHHCSLSATLCKTGEVKHMTLDLQLKETLILLCREAWKFPCIGPHMYSTCGDDDLISQSEDLAMQFSAHTVMKE